eukprot:RCo052330
MRTVHHNASRQSTLSQELLCPPNRGGVVVRSAGAPTEDEVGVLVSSGGDSRNQPVWRDAGKVVLLPSTHQCVHGYLNVSRGAVLDAHRQGQPGSQLTVDGTLHGASADRGPGKAVDVVLKMDRVEHLTCRGHTQGVDVQQQPAGDAQALARVKGPAKVGVIDQPLPSHSSAGLFKVAPHHQKELGGELSLQRRQPLCVLQRGWGIMDRARPDHHKQARVDPAEDPTDRRASPRDGALGLGMQRNALHQQRRGKQGVHLREPPRQPLGFRQPTPILHLFVVIRESAQEVPPGAHLEQRGGELLVDLAQHPRCPQLVHPPQSQVVGPAHVQQLKLRKHVIRPEELRNVHAIALHGVDHLRARQVHGGVGDAEDLPKA